MIFLLACPTTYHHQVLPGAVTECAVDLTPVLSLTLAPQVFQFSQPGPPDCWNFVLGQSWEYLPLLWEDLTPSELLSAVQYTQQLSWEVVGPATYLGHTSDLGWAE